MNTCPKCHSDRLMSISAQCDDSCLIKLDGQRHDGYIPKGCNLNYLMPGGDYIGFKVCANCGYLLGKWPLPEGIIQEDPEDII